jgi:dephospho-CoA kinase
VLVTGPRETLPHAAGPRVRRVALTGGIATGKSYVRARLEEAGIPTIDADTLAREVVAPGTPGVAAVVRRFGAGVLDAGGGLNRRALADIVFSDADARRDLEALIHPGVRRAMEAWFAALDPVSHPLAVADIPLLFETGRDRDFDDVIVVACDDATQLHRIMDRDGMNEAAARRRVAAQMPLEEKLRRASHIVRTDGTFDDTDRDVRRLLDRLAPRT